MIEAYGHKNVTYAVGKLDIYNDVRGPRTRSPLFPRARSALCLAPPRPPPLIARGPRAVVPSEPRASRGTETRGPS
jgi:hypothetical protein